MTDVVYSMTDRNNLRYHRLDRKQTVPALLENIFAFFESPENLAMITPPSLGFRVITAGPISMKQGRVIDYTIRLGGLPVRWRSLISIYEPPFCFVDEQLKGPYAYWRHTHQFESCARGTKVRDEVVYALPAALPAMVESMLHAVYVRPKLESIFDYRARFYADYFDADAERTCATVEKPLRVSRSIPYTAPERGVEAIVSRHRLPPGHGEHR